MPLLIGTLFFEESYLCKNTLFSLLSYLFYGTVVLQDRRPARGAFLAYDEYKTSLSYWLSPDDPI